MVKCVVPGDSVELCEDGTNFEIEFKKEESALKIYFEEFNYGYSPC